MLVYMVLVYRDSSHMVAKVFATRDLAMEYVAHHARLNGLTRVGCDEHLTTTIYRFMDRGAHTWETVVRQENLEGA